MIHLCNILRHHKLQTVGRSTKRWQLRCGFLLKECEWFPIIHWCIIKYHKIMIYHDVSWYFIIHMMVIGVAFPSSYHVSGVQNPCWLMFIRDYTTLHILGYIGDYFIIQERGIPFLTRIKWNNSQWIGLRENLQDTPIFNGKNLWFPVDFPLNQIIETEGFWTLLMWILSHHIPTGSRQSQAPAFDITLCCCAKSGPRQGAARQVESAENDVGTKWE